MARGLMVWIKPGAGAGGARGYARYLAAHEGAGEGAGMAGLAGYYGRSRLVRSAALGAEEDLGGVDAEALEAWLSWRDPATGESRGRIGEDTTVAVEMTVNHSKSFDVAALCGGDVAAALGAAHDRACKAVRREVAGRAMTRRRVRGVVTGVRAAGLEWALTTHATSREGDPELHTHMCLLSRVRAEGASGWYALWTGQLRQAWHLAQTVADVTLACDPQLRATMAAHGLDVVVDDDGTAHVAELEDAGRTLSKRHEQIEAKRAEMADQWRASHGGAEPDQAAWRAIDQAAWARTRKSKTAETATPDPDAWRAELAAAGHDLSRYAAGRAGVDAGTAPVPDAQAVAWAALDMLSASSAVSLLDAERAVWVAVGRSGVVAGEDGLRRIVDAVMPVVRRRLECLVPDAEAAQAAPWVRAWTTPAALRDETELTAQLRALGEARVGADRSAMVDASGLDRAQEDAARAVAGDAGLVVVTGAAGSGKTTMLRAACRAMDGEPLLVSPTARGAQEMAAATGAQGARTVAGLLRRAGLWDPEAGYAPLYDVRSGELRPPASACLPGLAGRAIVVDEAGMLEQAAAWRLAVVARCSGARLVLVGDQAQLGAVGRGGVMGIARGLCAPGATATLDVLHRFEDPAWAALTMDVRAGDEQAADALMERDADDVDGLGHAGAVSWGATDERVADSLAHEIAADPGLLVSCTTNQQARLVNARAQQLRLEAGELGDAAAPGMDECQLRAGDRVQTRLNDSRLGVCNRDTWTVTGIGEDGSVTLAAGARHATVPAEYAAAHVQLAYAVTTYGVQGATARHALHWAAAGAGAEDLYVGLTRGARSQRLALTATDRDKARDLLAQALTESHADLGVSQAREQAMRDLDRTPPVADAPQTREEPTPDTMDAPGPQASEDDAPDQDDEPQAIPKQLEADYWRCLDWWQVADTDLTSRDALEAYDPDGEDITRRIASGVIRQLKKHGRRAPRAAQDDWQEWEQDAAWEMALTMWDWEQDGDDLTDMRDAMDSAIERRSIDPPQQQMQPSPSADTTTPGMGMGF